MLHVAIERPCELDSVVSADTRHGNLILQVQILSFSGWRPLIACLVPSSPNTKPRPGSRARSKTN